MRKRRFRSAFMAVLAVPVVFLAVGGVRDDLLQQPLWQIGLQVVAWAIGLVAFPMIGVGLWFPSRSTRLGLGVAGIAAALSSSADWTGSGPQPHDAPCSLELFGSGLVFLAIGGLSGAFAQRRCRSAPFWIVGGFTLASLDLATWVCPDATPSHVMPSHLLPALALVVIAAMVAKRLRRR